MILAALKKQEVNVWGDTAKLRLLYLRGLVTLEQFTAALVVNEQSLEIIRERRLALLN